MDVFRIAVAFAFLITFCSSLPRDDMLEKDIATLVREKLHGHGDLLEEVVGPILPEDARETWTEFANLMDANDTRPTPVCGACQLGIAVLKNVSNSRSWILLRPTLITVCKQLLVVIDPETRVDDLCPGIIEITGKAIYDIMKEDAATPYKFCEHLNACIPPRPDIRLRKARKARINPNIGAESRGRFRGLLGKVDLGPNHPQQRSGSRLPLPAGSDNSTLNGTIRVVQLADVHIEPNYAVGSATRCGLPVCCQEKYGSGTAGQYGDYNCNVPRETMFAFLEKTAELDPHFVLYSGDTPPHTMWDETLDSQLDCTMELVDAIKDRLDGYSVYPNIGNHELYPTNLYYPPSSDTKGFNTQFTEGWAPISNFTDTQRGTMLDAGYYSIHAMPGLKIISFNTNFWYSFNFYNVLNEDLDEFARLKQHIEDELESARNNSDKVIMLGHHPPAGGDAIVTPARWLTDVCVTYSDVIVLHVAGHTHNDEFRLIRDKNTDETKGVVMVAPTSTTYGSKNPSLRIYYLHPETFELLDYDQYHLDIMETFMNGTGPNIKFVYSAKDEYGLDDLSPKSWEGLVDRMWGDYYVLGQHMHNYYTRVRDDPVATCGETCRINHVCKMSYSSYDRTLECQMNNPGAPMPTPGPTTPVPAPTTTMPVGSATSLQGTYLVVLALMTVARLF